MLPPTHTPSQGILGAIGSAWEYLTATKSNATSTPAFDVIEYIPFGVSIDLTILEENEELDEYHSLFYIKACPIGRDTG